MKIASAITFKQVTLFHIQSNVLLKSNIFVILVGHDFELINDECYYWIVPSWNLIGDALGSVRSKNSGGCLLTVKDESPSRWSGARTGDHEIDEVETKLQFQIQNKNYLLSFPIRFWLTNDSPTFHCFSIKTLFNMK